MSVTTKLVVCWLTVRVSKVKVTWPFDQVVLHDRARSQNHWFSITWCLWPPNPRANIHKPHDPLMTWSYETAWQIRNISPLPQYQLPANLTGSHDLSVIWSCQVTWQIKYILSPFTLDHWPQNLARFWLSVRGFHP